MQQLRYAWNTNGCANHRLYDALDLVADAGYQGLALTLDWHHLDPFTADWQRQAEKLSTALAQKQMGSVIETGARYLLNPKIKHEPTLLHPEAEGRAHRLHFLKRAVDIAALLGSEAVSFWAGKKQAEVAHEKAWQWLAESVAELSAYAQEKQVTLALEPEPGMLIETIEDLEQLRQQMADGSGQSLTLALDVGHVWVTGEMDPAEAVRQYAESCGTAAIEGMNRGVHEHLPLHKGDMDVADVLSAFQEQRFDKLICVELSRESHRAHEAIKESIETLRQMEQSGAAV